MRFYIKFTKPLLPYEGKAGSIEVEYCIQMYKTELFSNSPFWGIF